jgi:hypothetical protein
MYQGMVASVIGKFTNTSAHTSYLFLVKDPFPDSRVSPLPPAQKTRGSTISVCHDGSFLQFVRPVLVGPPIIY